MVSYPGETGDYRYTPATPYTTSPSTGSPYVPPPGLVELYSHPRYASLGKFITIAVDGRPIFERYDNPLISYAPSASELQAAAAAYEGSPGETGEGGVTPSYPGETPSPLYPPATPPATTYPGETPEYRYTPATPPATYPGETATPPVLAPTPPPMPRVVAASATPSAPVMPRVASAAPATTASTPATTASTPATTASTPATTASAPATTASADLFPGGERVEYGESSKEGSGTTTTGGDLVDETYTENPTAGGGAGYTDQYIQALDLWQRGAISEAELALQRERLGLSKEQLEWAKKQYYASAAYQKVLDEKRQANWEKEYGLTEWSTGEEVKLARDDHDLRKWMTEKGIAIDEATLEWAKLKWEGDTTAQATRHADSLAMEKYITDQRSAGNTADRDSLERQFYSDLDYRSRALSADVTEGENRLAWDKEKFYVQQKASAASSAAAAAAARAREARMEREFEFKKWATKKGFSLDEKGLDLAETQFARELEFKYTQASEELDFKRWATEKGFTLDEKNQAWLRESYYSDLKFRESEAASGRSFEREMSEAEMKFEREKASGWLTDKTPTLAREQMEIQRAYQLKTLAQQTEQFRAQQALEQQGLGLGYMEMMSGLRGPRDWLAYANTVRASEGSELPAFARALLNQQSIAQFQGAGASPYKSGMALPGGLVVGGAASGTPVPGSDASILPVARRFTLGSGAAAGPAIPGEAVPGARASGGDGSGAAASAAKPIPGTTPLSAAPGAWMQELAKNPMGISAAQWNNMLPYEQEMMRGAIEGVGADPSGWETLMRKSWVPRESVTPTTFWG